MLAPKAVAGILIAVGFLHLYPVVGALSADRLQALYGTAPSGDLLILMRHRALLFALLGGFFVYAAFRPALQPAAFAIGFFSMLSFVALAWLQGDYGPELRKVVIADLLASGALAVAVALYCFSNR